MLIFIAKNNLLSSLTLSLVQTDLAWENRQANLSMLQQKIEAIKNTEIVILPEMFTTGFSMRPELFAERMDGDTIAWMKKICAARKIILTGSLIVEENGNFFNRLIWMQPDGNFCVYDKRHLFAFSNEDAHYTAGEKKLIASVKGWKIQLQVCYDLRFPVWARQASAAEADQYDLLINVANWPESRSHAWKTLLCARAIENQCFVAAVNRVGEDGKGIRYSGDSSLIDPLGTVIYQKNDAEDIFTYKLEKEKISDIRNQYPFWKDADAFFIKS